VTTLDGAWSALVTTALLGTARRELPEPPGPPLDGFGDAAGTEPAAALLERAAAVVLARRAGAAPQRAPKLLVPAPDDHLLACPPPAARRLALLLDGHHPELLDEWLDRAGARGIALPPEHVVPLLRIPGDGDRRARIARAAGSRAQWLAGVLPELAHVLVPAGRERWDTGTVDERVDALRAWRSEAPEDARTALEATLGHEKALDRARLVGALAVGLGPGDEPLLERLLDDRGAEVRQRAAALLARLPSSAHGGRQSARLAAVARRIAGARGPSIELLLPTDLPADWKRDGIQPLPIPGSSRDALLAAALVAAAPLAAWAPLGPPAEVVAALAAHHDAAELVPALRRAAIAQRDERWAVELLAVADEPSLLAVVPSSVVAERLVANATPAALLVSFTAAACAQLPAPWPDPVARAVLGCLVGLFEDGRVTWAHRRAIEQLVGALDPRLLRPLATVLSGVPAHPHLSALQPAIAELAQFRHDLIEELT
jgi:hypothetical protein